MNLLTLVTLTLLALDMAIKLNHSFIMTNIEGPLQDLPYSSPDKRDDYIIVLSPFYAGNSDLTLESFKDLLDT